MADHAVDDDFDGDIFIYRGGRAPRHIIHALIGESVDEIEDHAFNRCEHLLMVDTHDGIRRVGAYAFSDCKSLRRMNLKSVVRFDAFAFNECENLESVEFGDKLETIAIGTFSQCTSLKHLKLPSIITIGVRAFYECHYLTGVELSERLQTIREGAFIYCKCLQRIAIPLKRDLFELNDSPKYTHFDSCDQLTKVDLVGKAHIKTISSLHMESWRTEMIAEINRINLVLPTTPADDKTEEIRQWMESVMDKLDHYKSEHCRYMKEGITLLELALWKAKLGEKGGYCEEGTTKKAKVDAESARKERRITCRADMVIKNVLPFLQLK